MKKLMLIGAAIAALALAACPVFASIIDEDENEIVMRHEKRMETIVRNAVQAKELSADEVNYDGKIRDKIKSDREQQKNDAVNAAIADLCSRLGIDEKKIKDFGYTITSSGVAQREPPIIFLNMVIGLVYKGETYIYDGQQIYDSISGDSGAAQFTGNVIPTAYDKKGSLILNATEIEDKPNFGYKPQTKEEKVWVKSVTEQLAESLGVKEKEVSFLGISQWATNGGMWGDYAKPGEARIWDMPSGYQLAFMVDGRLYLARGYWIGGGVSIREVPYFSNGMFTQGGFIHEGDVLQRKDLEAEIELKGNAANYTVSGQMAGAPEEVLPLQKKQ